MSQEAQAQSRRGGPIRWLVPETHSPGLGLASVTCGWPMSPVGVVGQRVMRREISDFLVSPQGPNPLSQEGRVLG